MDVAGERKDLENFINTAVYQNAQVVLRDLLRRHLLAALGDDWETIHSSYGMYTINCRAKDTRRTLEKFDRLISENREVTSKNFFAHMPDLVAGRLVVVDPYDIFPLAELVRKQCNPPKFMDPNRPLVNCRVRHGRFSMYDTESFRNAGYCIDQEATGYCSVHFVFRTGEDFFAKCINDEVKCLRALHASGRIPMSAWQVEIQVRTLMDEAWGETDHFVRYQDPALRDDPVIRDHFAVLASYLQAANHHVSLIRRAAQLVKGRKDGI